MPLRRGILFEAAFSLIISIVALPSSHNLIYVNLKAATRYIIFFFISENAFFRSKAKFVQPAINLHIQADRKCLFVFFTLFIKQMICIVCYKFYLKKPQRKWFRVCYNTFCPKMWKYSFNLEMHSSYCTVNVDKSLLKNIFISV